MHKIWRKCDTRTPTPLGSVCGNWCFCTIVRLLKSETNLQILLHIVQILLFPERNLRARITSHEIQASPSKNKNIRLYLYTYVFLVHCQDPAVVFYICKDFSLRCFRISVDVLKHIYKHLCPGCYGYRHRKMDTVRRVQILDETDWISHSTNTLGKRMNPIILPPAMGNTVWACQWPSSQPLSSPQFSHNNSLWV